MSIYTFSKFYWGFEVDGTNNKLDFNEGSGEVTATIDYGSYTPEEIATEIQSKLNAAGNNTYTASFNRTTRILTIASDSSMVLLTNTGSNSENTIFTDLGYSTASDTSSATSHAAGSTLGGSYTPQFILQDYIPTTNWIEQLHSTVNETVTGSQELITFGDKSMMQCNIKYITNVTQPSDGPITNNASGVSNALTFLAWICKKNKVQFMPDKDTVATYENLVLDSSSMSKDGTILKLKENYDIGLPQYYETGVLVFRKVN